MLSSLNAKVFVATVAMLTIMVVFSDAILNLVVVPRFEESDRAIALLNVTRIKSSMAGEVTELDGVVDDWAFWDDTYAFAAGSRPDYVADNLYLKAMSEIRVNAFNFYHQDGTLLQSVGYDLATGAPIDIAELASVAKLVAVPANAAPDAERPHGGLILTSRGPVFASAAPILTSHREGPPHGALVVARLFGPAQIAAMRERTGASFDIWAANAMLPPAVAPIGAALLAHADEPVFEAAGGHLTTYFSVPDVNGAPALIVATETDMVGSALGRRAVFLAELCLVAVGLVNLVLFFFQIRYLVLKPLTRMEQHIVRVGATG
ncbi:MAG TPA: CHASE4 domain-containing protein, partial [Stellaceae bacterium]|nr:CHASE4 domain-containing protein [Stellaceae bacterium]